MTEKNNNKGLIITVIVLLCLIVILLLGFMGFVIFANSGAINFNFTNSKIIYDESYSADAVGSITVNSNCGDIRIKQSTGTDIRIVANGKNADNFSCTNNTGALTIESTSQGSVKVVPFLNIGNIATDIDIYLPSDFAQPLEINSSYGDFFADTLNGEFAIHTDCGDIDIDYVNISKSSSITGDLGDIEIGRTNNIRIDYETSLGDCDVKSNNTSSDIVLTVKTDLGDIEING